MSKNAKPMKGLAFTAPVTATLGDKPINKTLMRALSRDFRLSQRQPEPKPAVTVRRYPNQWVLYTVGCEWQVRRGREASPRFITSDEAYRFAQEHP